MNRSISSKVKTSAEPAIAPLTPAESADLSTVLTASRPEYLAHFHPFAFDTETVRGQIERARRDRYWGIRVAGELAGFFMLRGFDEGYERPAFGVFIAEDFAGRGLAHRALNEATRWCEENAVREMMLTVYEENTAAVRVYENAGFAATGHNRGKIIMSKRLSE